MKNKFSGNGRFSGSTSPRRKKNVQDWFREAAFKAMKESGYIPTNSWDNKPDLHQCPCGAPTWQQPCVFCGFYPMGNDLQEYNRVKGTMTKEKFIKRVEAAGGLVPLWVSDKKKSITYAIGTGRQKASSFKEFVECQKFVEIVDKAIAYAKKQKDSYTPEEIWDAIQESGQQNLFHPWQ